MPKNLSFVKELLDSDNLLTINVNRETLQESNIIKVISKKLVSKAIEMLQNLAVKDKYKNEKDNKIDDDAKEVDINEVAETDNDRTCCRYRKRRPFSSGYHDYYYGSHR